MKLIWSDQQRLGAAEGDVRVESHRLVFNHYGSGCFQCDQRNRFPKRSIAL